MEEVDGPMRAEINIKRISMGLEDVVRTREETFPIISMIRITELEKEDDMDLVEEVLVEPFFNMEKKVIGNMSIPSGKEG